MGQVEEFSETLGGSEFFSFGDGDRAHGAGIHADQDGSLLSVFAQDSGGPLRSLHGLMAPGFLRTNQWYHIGTVSGSGGMKLYLDGTLLATNKFAESFSSIKTGGRLRLGRSVVDDEPFFDGQLTEVRVWRVARTEEQIRGAMFISLTGNEPGLAGLWSFKDGTFHDGTPGASDGHPMGQAKITDAVLPSSVEPLWFTRIGVRIVDAAGGRLENVKIRAEVNGEEVPTAQSGGFEPGDNWLSIFTKASSVDLLASGPNGLGSWKLAVPVSTKAQQHLGTWVLRPLTSIAGRINALDGKASLADVVVELVEAAAGSQTLGWAEPQRAATAAEARTTKVLHCRAMGATCNFRLVSLIT